MTTEEFRTKLTELSDISAQGIIVPAANGLLARVKNRIQLDGQNSNGSSIGAYSSKEGYYSKQQFDKKGSFKAIGKTGKKTKSTMYIATGYKGLREIQGKPTGSVNETYTGSTMLAYQMQPISNGAVIGFTTQKASLIRKGQEAKKGKIFSPTQEEMNIYNEEVATEAKKVIEAILNA
jgi:hypothetical protein